MMLMYHSVIPEIGYPKWPWAVSIQRFHNQVDFPASESWVTPTMAELVTAPDQFHERTVVLTFDDGYVDNLAAAEELQQRVMWTTWFIVTALSVAPQPGAKKDSRVIDT